MSYVVGADGRARAALTKTDAAAYLGCSRDTVARLVAQGHLPIVHLPGTTAERIRVADLDALLAKHAAARNPASAATTPSRGASAPADCRRKAPTGKRAWQ